MSGGWLAAVVALSAASGWSGHSLLAFVRREQPHTPGCDQGRGDLGEWDGRADSEGRFPPANLIGEELALRELDAETHIERLEAALRGLWRNAEGEAGQLLLALAALAAVVRAEYGDEYSLAEIAAMWGGGVPAGQISALEALEARLLAKPDDELVDDLGQGRDE